MVFIDVEKAYNKAPREVLKWVLIKIGLPKVYKIYNWGHIWRSQL